MACAGAGSRGISKHEVMFSACGCFPADVPEVEGRGSGARAAVGSGYELRGTGMLGPTFDGLSRWLFVTSVSARGNLVDYSR